MSGVGVARLPVAGPAGGDPVRDVLLQHAKGVAVITAGTGTPVGFCATSLATVSLDPAIVSFSVRVCSVSWATIRSADRVVVHLLGAGQEDLARRFGRPGAAKFDPPTRWHRDAGNLPVLDDVLAWLVLAPAARLRVEEHDVVVGHVVRAGHGTVAGPLVHHAGRYATLPPVPPAGPRAT